MKRSQRATDQGKRTIEDFGRQWVRYRANKGYYGSIDLLADITGPLLGPADIVGRKVIDIGSGTGRIANMLLECGAAHVTAVEPSEAFYVMKSNICDPTRTTCLKIPGDRIPGGEYADLALSIGVLHHVPEPEPVVRAAYKALRPGGRMLVWLYGREGNGLYLAVVKPLRVMTVRLPHALLSALVRALDIPFAGYTWACRYFPLPMSEYLNKHLSHMDAYSRRLIIYDQLNPAYAKYYSCGEAYQLLANAGFTDIQTYHRHGYSWTVMGNKPAND